MRKTSTTPVYRREPGKVKTYAPRRLLTMALVEDLFFGAAMLFTFGFAFVLLRQGLTAWSSVAYLLVFWAVLAYLALPRLHRVLTAIYVPGYFIGRSRTTDGLLGDPINLALRGSADQVHAAMRRAGWVQADPVNVESSWRIVRDSVARRSYPEAPVSPLMLFGRIQEFTYQQEVEGNPAQRHHVRFWPTPPGWPLPGGHRVDWLAAGTYDRAVGLSLFTLQITHKIDRDIDIERDYIVESLRCAVPEASVTVIEDFATSYHSRNGGGDAVVTDGDLPVVELEQVVPDASTARLDETSRPDGTPWPGDGQAPTDRGHRLGRRPLSVVLAGLLTLGSLSTWLIAGIVEALTTDWAAGDPGTPQDGDPRLVAVALVAATYAVLFLFAWLTYQGRAWARLLMLALLSFSLLMQLLPAVGSERPTAAMLGAMSVDLLTIYALTSMSAREWTGGERAHSGSAGVLNG